MMDADIPITLHSASATNMRVDFYYAQSDTHWPIGPDVTISAGVKHAGSDGTGICFFLVSDLAGFPGLPFEARPHHRTIRGWWWA
jgi:hypothetical protein